MSDGRENNTGRPKTNIDWNIVDQLLISGCSGTEIAAYIGIKPTNLYDRCWTDKGVNFSEYSQEKQAKGESILRSHQFAKAIGKTTEGDNTLLIWLGKTRLKQKDESYSKNTSQITVNVGKELGSGLNISTSTLPDESNNSSE